MEILVVEDDEAIRELIVYTLGNAGYESSAASDGIEGLDQLKRRRPSAVLLDVNMPRMDGFAMLEHMKADESMRDLPVLMLTAQSSPEDIRRGIRLGASDYIGKPFEPRQLLRRIQRMLRQ